MLVGFVLILVNANVSSAEIKIGMSTALTGQVKALGQSMRHGVETYFQKINRTGGINGHELQLIVQDDGYQPRKTTLNMRSLIDEHGVLAIIGNVGTPTALVAMPIAGQLETLLFAPFSGAKELRKKKHFNYVMNYRPSYKDEVVEMVDGLISMGIQPQEIALFTQHDSYGDAGFSAVRNALEKHGFDHLEILAHGRYTRNTLNVESALAALLDVPIEPKAVIMFGSYQASAKFIKLAKKEFPGMVFVNSSFVGGRALAKSLAGEMENVFVMQVVPDFKSNLPAAIEYRHDMSKYSPELELSHVSFEGYISAKILVEGIRKTIKNLNRQTIVKSLYELDQLDIGIGQVVGFSTQTNQATNKVWPTMYRHDHFYAFDWQQCPCDQNEARELF